MGGLIITPREQDFRRLTAELLTDIYRELSITDEQVQEVIRRMKNAPLTTHHTPHTSQEEPNVKVGIVSGQKIHFALNGAYTAKGETIEGKQTVEFYEGGILWNGNQYSSLVFTPQNADASFSLFDVTIGVNFH